MGAETQNTVPDQMVMGAAMGAATGSPLESSGFVIASNVQWVGETTGTWEIIGDDSQVLVTVLKQGQELLTEPGSLLSMSSFIQPDIKYDAQEGCKRSCCAGESCFQVRYTNNLPLDQTVTVTPSYPAKVIPLQMDQHPAGMVLTANAWMSSLGGQHTFDVDWAPSFMTACCAGMGCCLTTVQGPGLAFVNAGGTALKRVLAPGESVTIDTFSLVAYEKTVAMEVVPVGGCVMMCCGGSGMYNTKLTGPGTIVIASMPPKKMKAGMRVQQPGEGGGGGDGGGGGGA